MTEQPLANKYTQGIQLYLYHGRTAGGIRNERAVFYRELTKLILQYDPISQAHDYLSKFVLK